MVGSVWKQMVILVPDRVLVRFIRWSFFASISTHFPPFTRLYTHRSYPVEESFLLYFTLFILYLRSFFTYFLLA